MSEPTKMESGPFGFAQAIEVIKLGRGVTRGSWNDPERVVRIQRWNGKSANKTPYLFIEPKGERQLWLNTDDDLLATDWFEVVPAKPEKPNAD